ncbi:PhoU domain-containing protein, partial [Bartonella grahamii]|uniref:PhoU domain-containing protein n=1 Tax=Bartonella grahamii TaxID=33045 RepID=UPI0031B8553D
MSMNHTVRSYDAELKYLKARITEMGSHAERMLESSVASVVCSVLQLATTVIVDDAFLDEAERDIDEKAVAIICKRQ